MFRVLRFIPQSSTAMDGISSLAISAFETTQKFGKPGPGYTYDAVEVAIFPEDIKLESGEAQKSPRPGLTQHQIPELGIDTWFDDTQWTATEPIPEASLRVVQIDRNLDVSLHISRECFARLFEAMRADPAVKYMICHDYDGFHEFSAPGYLTTRFIGNPIYAILWTFDPLRVATRALFIRRRLQHFSNFTSILGAFQSYIYTPLLPGFVSSYLMLKWSDRETSDVHLRVVRHVEERTGFGPHPSGMRGLQAAGMEGKFDINVLTSWSQAVNEVSGNIGNMVRHQKISRTVLGMIADASWLEQSGGVPHSFPEKHRRSLEALSRAVPLLERQLNTDLDYLGYLKDRAEKLSAVVSGYLAHAVLVQRPCC